MSYYYFTQFTTVGGTFPIGFSNGISTAKYDDNLLGDRTTYEELTGPATGSGLFSVRVLAFYDAGAPIALTQWEITLYRDSLNTFGQGSYFGPLGLYGSNNGTSWTVIQSALSTQAIPSETFSLGNGNGWASLTQTKAANFPSLSTDYRYFTTCVAVLRDVSTFATSRIGDFRINFETPVDLPMWTGDPTTTTDYVKDSMCDTDYTMGSACSTSWSGTSC